MIMLNYLMYNNAIFVLLFQIRLWCKSSKKFIVVSNLCIFDFQTHIILLNRLPLKIMTHAS